MAPKIRTVVIAVDATPKAERSLEIGVELAARLDAEVDLRFVENEDLVRLAALPFGRRFAPGMLRLDPLKDGLEAEFRAWAAMYRRELQRHASRLKLSAHFRVIRRCIRFDTFTPGEGELLFEAWRGRGTWAHESRPQACAPVAVWVDDSAAALDALHSARALEPERLVVLVAPEAKVRMARVRGIVRDALGEFSTRTEIRPVPETRPASAVQEALNAGRGAWFVLSQRQHLPIHLSKLTQDQSLPINVLWVA